MILCWQEWRNKIIRKMNKLYILGNGFDKAQGMHTSYLEFYQYLMKNTSNGSALLQQLKQEIKADKKLWSDMEVALGEFTDKVKSADDFESLYFELSECLQTYLKNEEKYYNPSDQQKEKFIQDLINPFKYIGTTDTANLDILQSRKDPVIGTSSVEHISVITLNYTNTLERLLPNDIVTTKIPSNGYKIDNYHYLEIIHVHGQLDDSIIIGVDNEEQIKNEQFKENIDICDLLVKKQSNRVMGNTRQEQCERLIRNADVIILYGVSLGETDAHWWNLIREMFIEKDLYIIQHLYKDNYTEVLPTRKQLYGRRKRENRLDIMKKLGLGEEEGKWPKHTDERLFFITNSNIFKM